MPPGAESPLECICADIHSLECQGPLHNALQVDILQCALQAVAQPLHGVAHVAAPHEARHRLLGRGEEVVLGLGADGDAPLLELREEGRRSLLRAGRLTENKMTRNEKKADDQVKNGAQDE